MFMLHEHARRRSGVTIIIPCYNERDTIAAALERVLGLAIDKTVLVVDNCSTDGSRELLALRCGSSPVSRDQIPLRLEALEPDQALMRGDGFWLVLQPRNRGKGASVKTGIALANSEYLVCHDADLEYDPRDIARLVEHAIRTGAAAVFGSRLEGCRAPQWDSYHWGRVALAGLFQLLYGGFLTDVATCYKLMRTDVARRLDPRANGFELDFELAAKLYPRRHQVHELPISYRPRALCEGKKIRWRHGVTAVLTLLFCWFTHGPLTMACRRTARLWLRAGSPDFESAARAFRSTRPAAPRALFGSTVCGRWQRRG